ncbi:hypothetical protein AB3S75_003160 [Citrus x aurantiifolia]
MRSSKTLGGRRQPTSCCGSFKIVTDFADGISLSSLLLSLASLEYPTGFIDLTNTHI